MSKVSADYIFPVSGPPIKNGVVSYDNGSGRIEDIIDPEKYDGDIDEVQKFEGILVPGFVNTHCHLELSYLKGKVSPGTGLPRFLKDLLDVRFTIEDGIKEAIAEAEDEMIGNGIVAVGDISNFSQSFEQKAKGNIKYHTFVEALTIDPKMAEAAFERAQDVVDDYKKYFSNDTYQASITPHAPYSVSEELYELISRDCFNKLKITSIHNQECGAENELFVEGTGALFDLFKGMDIDMDHWEATGNTSIRSTLPRIDKSLRTLLVHNTFSSKEDIEWAEGYSDNLYWCLCPKANLYIENDLPAINTIVDTASKITIGTDSLASNDGLSVLEEMKAIQANYPEIETEYLVKWATLNGAEFLGFDELGSFEKGKTPGINHISKIDLMNFDLTESKVERII